MPPKITSETIQDIQEAAPGEVAIGDFVTWERDGSLIRGQINTLWAEGEVEVPHNDDAPKLIASAENPIARMDVFEPNWEGEGWRRSNWQVVQYVSNLTKIVALPESIDQENTEEIMATTPAKPGTTEGQETDVDSRIITMQEQHQAEVRELSRKLALLQANERTLNSLRDMLGVKEGQDPVLALQAQVSTLQTLQRENIELLETAIKQEVSTHVKVAWAQGVVEQAVRTKKPLSRAEVVAYTQEVLTDPHIAVIVKNATQQAMGPNVEITKSNIGELGQQGNSADVFILVPGMGMEA